MEVLSPEVVLVDEQLAEAARAALPAPPDVFDVLARARAGDAVRKMRVSFNTQEAADEAELVRRRPRSRRRLLGAGIAAAVAVAGTVPAVATLGRDEVSTARALASNSGPSKPHRQAVASHAAPRQRPVVGTAVTMPAPRKAAKAKPQPVRTQHRAAPRRPVTAPRPRKAHVPTAKPAASPRPAKAAPRVGTAVVRPESAPVLTWPIQRQATYYRVAVYRLGRAPGFLFEVWTDKTRLAVPATWGSAGEHNRLEPGTYGWAVFPTFGALGEAPADRAAATPLTGGRFTL